MAMRFFFLINALLFSVDSYSKGKYSVCTVSINSTDEKEVFTNYLKDKDFEFHELTDFVDKKIPHSNEWFDKACESGVSCDILLISGHFAGTFFGNSNLELPLSKMENHSCSKTCLGILSQPKEVFLFGCNTLASKEKDSRTPQEYLRVLVADGIPQDEAERVVAARYSPLGQSFKERMQRTFVNVNHIYGFSSIGPSGKTVRPFLNNFFKTIPDYKVHLDKLEAERLSSTIVSANKILASALAKTAFAECNGLKTSDPEYKFKEVICQLYDTKSSLIQKLKVAESMFSSSDRLMYIPSLINFFEINHVSISKSDPDTLKVLSAIRNNQVAKNEFISLLSATKASPLTYAELTTLGTSVGWLSSSEKNQLLGNAVIDLLKKPSKESTNAICRISDKYGISPKISIENFPQGVRDQNSLESAACLRTTDSTISTQALSFVKSLNEKNLYVGIIQLGKFNVENKDLNDYLISSLQDPKTRSAALEAISMSQSRDRRFDKVIGELLNEQDKESIKTALYGIANRKTDDVKVQDRIFEIFTQNEKDLAYHAALALKKCELSDSIKEKVIKDIIQSKPNSEALNSILQNQTSFSSSIQKKLVDAIKTEVGSSSEGLADALARLPKISENTQLEIINYYNSNKLFSNARKKVILTIEKNNPTNPVVLKAIENNKKTFESLKAMGMFSN